MSTYSIVVALHIIAVLAAYGLPLSAPLVIPYVRRRHPEALPGLHAAQHFVNNAITGPFTVLLLIFGVYLASDGNRWGDPFVTIGIGAVAIIAVVGGGVVVPAVRALAGLDPASAEYDRVYRRYLRAEGFLGIVVLLTVFAMAAKPFS
jgi:hypothetical protein